MSLEDKLHYLKNQLSLLTTCLLHNSHIRATSL